MKNPIAVVITDTHMSDKNIPLVKDIFKQTFEYCKANKINHIFHGGDWFTSRTGQSIATLLATREILESMSRDYDLEMWAIAGNHDKADQNIPESFLSVFEKWEGFHLIEIVGGYPIQNSKVYVGMVPFFTEEAYSAELLELTDFILDDKPKGYKHFILVTHVAVNGVKNNDGSEVTTGYNPNTFSRWDKVLIGHYHNKSKVGKNIYYIGSAYQANFGEDNEKGITVIYDDGSIEQVKLKFPEFVKFSIDAKSITSADIKDIQKIKEEHPERNIRIILTGTEEEINSFNKSLLTDMGVSVDKKPSDVENLDPEEEIEMVSYNKDNLLPVFEEFCDYKNIEDRDYGRQLINEL